MTTSPDIISTQLLLQRSFQRIQRVDALDLPLCALNSEKLPNTDTIISVIDTDKYSGIVRPLRKEAMADSTKQEDLWHIKATINGKTMSISVGDASQRIKWLAHVAIARWDEENCQGWKLLGTPTSVRNGKREIDMGLVIKDVLQDGDHVTIFSSLLPI